MKLAQPDCTSNKNRKWLSNNIWIQIGKEHLHSVYKDRQNKLDLLKDVYLEKSRSMIVIFSRGITITPLSPRIKNKVTKYMYMTFLKYCVKTIKIFIANFKNVTAPQWWYNYDQLITVPGKFFSANPQFLDASLKMFTPEFMIMKLFTHYIFCP